MTELLKNIDNSKNMEDLRYARSYNDVVFVLSRIKNACFSIQSRVSKYLSSLPKEHDVSITEEKAHYEINENKVKAALSDLESLLAFHHEVKYSSSLTNLISNGDKLDKFNRVMSSVESTVIHCQNVVIKYLDEIGTRAEPSKLSDFSITVDRFISHVATFSKKTSFVVFEPGNRASFSHYKVIYNLRTDDGYIVPMVMICLRADSNYDGTFTYKVSYPNKILVRATETSFSTKRELSLILADYFSSSIDVSSIPSGKKGRKSIEVLDEVSSTYIFGNDLWVELNNGINGTAVNRVVTSVLTTLSGVLNVDDPRTDLAHKVETTSRGNKAIRIRLIDRNFYDKRELKRLKRLLSLDSKTYENIKNIVGAEYDERSKEKDA